MPQQSSAINMPNLALIWKRSTHLWYTYWDKGRVTRVGKRSVQGSASNTIFTIFSRMFLQWFCRIFSDFAPSCWEFSEFTEFFAFKSLSKFAVTFLFHFALSWTTNTSNFHVFHTYMGRWVVGQTRMMGLGTRGLFFGRFLVGIFEGFLRKLKRSSAF